MRKPRNAGEGDRCPANHWTLGGERLPIQFKVAPVLLLRLNPIRRLSIDVDIVTQARPEELQRVLGLVGKLAPLATALNTTPSETRNYRRKRNISESSTSRRLSRRSTMYCSMSFSSLRPLRRIVSRLRSMLISSEPEH